MWGWIKNIPGEYKAGALLVLVMLSAILYGWFCKPDASYRKQIIPAAAPAGVSQPAR